jgi:acylphosphatase
MRVRVRAVFAGSVQGVFFRAHAKKFANSHGVDGWVRNTEEGDVEALFEGEEDAVNAVIHDCQYSQPYARVEKIDIKREEPKGDLKGFRINY